MTNAAIIEAHRRVLMTRGIIRPKGRTEGIDSNGTPYAIDEPEDIYTERAWRKRGYRVRHGEEARATFPIWKYWMDRSVSPPLKNYYMADVGFYTADQVVPIYY
ncbi:MAG: hypothetical protein IJV16_00010 [Lachnospiraceae bacterium]|nr:hypothetical protein [Lachnospiraceae bacterium]